MIAVVVSVLCGTLTGAIGMAIWATSRINEEGVRQFDRGFERGRWLTEVAEARNDGGAADRVAALLAVGTPPSLVLPQVVTTTKELILAR